MWIVRTEQFDLLTVMACERLQSLQRPGGKQATCQRPKPTRERTMRMTRIDLTMAHVGISAVEQPSSRCPYRYAAVSSRMAYQWDEQYLH